MFKFSCQNKIAKICVMVKAISKCEYRVRIAFKFNRGNYILVGHEKLCLGLTWQQTVCRHSSFQVCMRQNITTKIMCNDW